MEPIEIKGHCSRKEIFHERTNNIFLKKGESNFRRNKKFPKQSLELSLEAWKLGVF